MIYVVTGPTGTGKSSFAIKLALKVNGEIINGDAFQVYRKLNIGTAKPSKEQLAIVPHHLYDIANIDEDYTVKEYQRDARKKIEEILSRDKTPIICGGTGLYIRATLYDYEFSDLPRVDMKEYEALSNEELHALLEKVDSESAKKFHPNNRRRVLRALEIYLASGEAKSDLEAKQNHHLLYEVTMIGLKNDRETLYKQLDNRVDIMVKDGLFEEIDSLLTEYDPSSRAFQAIGYQQIISGHKNNKTNEEIIIDIKKVTRNYAKRQLTFFNHQLPVKWFPSWKEALNFVEENNENCQN